MTADQRIALWIVVWFLLWYTNGFDEYRHRRQECEYLRPVTCEP